MLVVKTKVAEAVEHRQLPELEDVPQLTGSKEKRVLHGPGGTAAERTGVGQHPEQRLNLPEFSPEPQGNTGVA